MKNIKYINTKDINTKDIAEIYNELPTDCNEANICHKVVIKLLGLLGYEEKFMSHQERKYTKDTCDILYTSPIGEQLIVEVKRKDKTLDNECREQLSKYLNSQNIKWGILTNGNQYLLINNKLNLDTKDRYCLQYNLIHNNDYHYSKETNNIFLTYFSNHYLLNTSTIDLFAYFHLYRILKLSEDSLKQYESANHRFIQFLIQLEDGNVSTSDLTPKNCKKFLIKLANTSSFSYANILSCYRYILSFVNFLESENKLQNKNEFTHINTEEFLVEFNIPKNKTRDLVNFDEINLLLNSSINPTRNNLKNSIILKLICYLGLDRNTIINIKLDDFNFNKINTYITVNNHSFLLPSRLSDEIKNYIIHRKKDKIKYEYLFYTKRTIGATSYQKIKGSTINHTIRKLSTDAEGISEERKIEITFNLLKLTAIREMYNNNFTLEEIALCTNLDIKSIYSSLTEEQKNKCKINLNKRLLSNHPFKDIL
ncbi:type I restriction enzyme HsdR N-terminal domain-containing protein [Clostridium gasigenes]|uniref:type I restriction enzyme HsdR N-terminal domain-containing protein n=1 Tax=Clostridium gasigenes TaxID=94869 RepID=UPI001C0AEF22|nr:type I restriction enzyme HsdR N-terminal domain-containing protein [Clostridium gasigenes]MBU3135030.1 type I restriction enzyme HsdR N-terminal domain-containing protein [Clostridium gasigenes]